MDGGPPSKPEFIRALLSPERFDPYRLLTRLPLDPYHHVADIGCGPGYFSVPLAKVLPHGRLYAVDVDPEMLEALRRRVEDARLGNVTTLLSDGTALPLEPGAMDGVLLAFVVHAVADRVELLRAAARSLRRNGWCCVLEWYRVETDHGPPVERRMDPKETLAAAREAGLTLTGRRELAGHNQYMMLFQKRA